MRAVRLNAWGIENIHVEDVADPAPAAIGATARKIVADGADALFDTTTSLGHAGLGAVKDGCLLATFTDPPESERGIRVTKVYGLPDGDALQRLANMASAGQLHTSVAREFKVEQARAAYEEFASGPHRGRIVLTFWSCASTEASAHVTLSRLENSCAVPKPWPNRIKVSPYALGALMFATRVGNPDPEDSIRIIHKALDAGINLVDTADAYGDSEEIVGRALKGRRDHVVLATKVSRPMGTDPNQQGASRRWIMTAVENSLRRLQTDYIDVYQIHRPDPDTDIGKHFSR